MKITLSGEVGWDILADDFKAKLDEANGDITLYVDSVGGDVFVGSAIYQAIKGYNKGKVKVIIGALAASAASYFVLAADEIVAYNNSTYMIHEARATVWAGTSKEMISKANAIDGINKMYVQAYMDRSGKSKEDIEMLMSAETYFFGSDILTHGFVDNIIEDEQMSAKAENNLEYQRARLTACKNNCKARHVDAKPMVARKEPNPLLDEVNKIMESVR